MAAVHIGMVLFCHIHRRGGWAKRQRAFQEDVGWRNLTVFEYQETALCGLRAVVAAHIGIVLFVIYMVEEFEEQRRRAFEEIVE